LKIYIMQTLSLQSPPRALDASHEGTRGTAIFAVALSAILGACSFPRPEEQQRDADGRGSDAPPPDGPRGDSGLCVPGYIDLCLVTPRAEELTVTNGSTEEINTGTDPRCVVKTQASGPDLCILYFTKIDIQQGGTVVAYGSRVLALASTSTLTIAGILDVASRRSRLRKPGPGISTCTFTLAPEADAGGAGGGAGGTFATVGANGGIGDINNNGGAAGTGLGGTIGATVSLPSPLRGGCNGQLGATGVEAGGSGGLAGGGIYVFAKGVLTVTGRLLATGGGGGGGGKSGGGGGGGSGGLIVVESETRSVLSGLFLATGGGGGEGGVLNGDGTFGGDPSSTAAAPGGSQQLEGGDGGAGATYLANAVVAPTAGGNEIGGGGGGGGGNGFILVLGKDRQTTGTFAPAALQP
jgi:hypothetical protein